MEYWVKLFLMYKNTEKCQYSFLESRYVLRYYRYARYYRYSGTTATGVLFFKNLNIAQKIAEVKCVKLMLGVLWSSTLFKK